MGLQGSFSQKPKEALMIHSHIIQRRCYYKSGIDETNYSDIVWQRKKILDKYEILKQQDCEDFAILDVLQVSRATLYRWKSNFKKYGLIGLEPNSRAPRTKRKPGWSKELEIRIYKLRKEYPVWGKAKIAIMYEQKYGQKVPVSTVGRILKKLVKTKDIVPVKWLLFGKIHQTRVLSGHAKRLPKGLKSTKVGELVQIDHMTVQIPGHGYLKHFSAICPITKIAVEEIYRTATSQNGAVFLEKVLRELPFPVISIQVDGGSEFMGDFESLCAKRGINLFVLPPKRPDLNGGVERANSTFKYEFYAQHHGSESLIELQDDLYKFVRFYNKVRPHHGVGLLTPYAAYELISKNGGLQSHM